MYYSKASKTAEFQNYIIILNLVFGDANKGIQLKTKEKGRANESRTGFPLAFYDGNGSTDSYFGFTPSASDTKTADKDGITKSADGIGAEMNEKWIHITVDIDFDTCKLYAKLENKSENFVREFIGEATKNADTFKQGLKSVKLCGNKKDVEGPQEHILSYRNR